MSWDITDIDSYYRTPEGVLVADILAAELSHQCGLGLIRALTDTTEQLAVGYPFPLYSPGSIFAACVYVGRDRCLGLDKR